MLIVFENVSGGPGAVDAFDVAAVFGAQDKSGAPLLGTCIVQLRGANNALHVRGSVREVVDAVNAGRLRAAAVSSGKDVTAAGDLLVVRDAEPR